MLEVVLDAAAAFVVPVFQLFCRCILEEKSVGLCRTQCKIADTAFRWSNRELLGTVFFCSHPPVGASCAHIIYTFLETGHLCRARRFLAAALARSIQRFGSNVQKRCGGWTEVKGFG